MKLLAYILIGLAVTGSGFALLMAIESYHRAGRLDEERLQQITEGTRFGFFPALGGD